MSAAAPPLRVALLIIDVQNDFVEGGALAVPGGLAAVPAINSLRRAVAHDGRVFLSQDWHPPTHASFVTNNAGAAPFSLVDLPGIGPQVMWPPHCVQGTPGADFVAALDRAPATDFVVRKGSNARVDSYSAFGDGASPAHALERTVLEDELRARGVTHVVCCGLALDYCVSFTAKDAAAAGFKVTVVLSGTAGIAPESTEKELAAMAVAGVTVVASERDLPAELLRPRVA